MPVPTNDPVRDMAILNFMNQTAPAIVQQINRLNANLDKLNTKLDKLLESECKKPKNDE